MPRLERLFKCWPFAFQPLMLGLVFTASPVNAEVKRSLLVDLEERYLYLKENEKMLSRYPIAVGNDQSPTPRGDFSIMRKDNAPRYMDASGNIHRPGPNSPVGTKLLLIHVDSKGSYAIHGTPWPVWVKSRSRVTKGCIRMLNPHIEEIFSLVEIGDTVVVK